MTEFCSYPRCSNASASTTDGVLLQYCDAHVPPASYEEYDAWLASKDAVCRNSHHVGSQRRGVREPFIVVIQQTRQRLEGRPMVLVLPDGSGNSCFLCEHWSYHKHKQMVELSRSVVTARSQ